MKTPLALATVALAAISFSPQAWSQSLFGRKPAAKTSATVDSRATRASVLQDPADIIPGSLSGSAPRAINAQPLRDNAEIPAPEMENSAPTGPQIPLPTGQLEPYLLTKDNGPFMVLAYTYRSPDAPRQALALVLELRNKYRLPAYILLPKKFPNGSNIRGVPPQAATFATRDDVGVPEIYRTLDEAAVLVGDEKTIKDSNILMHKVKKIHPVCIDGVAQMWDWRKGKGLTRATMTTNPFVPAENLFPQQRDILVSQINEGPHNIRNCPGRYTLEIANFEGHKAMQADGELQIKTRSPFAKSPLATAADDAERLADSLAKDKQVQQIGFEPYVYHDRYSSRVTMGSFDSPNDPKAKQLHDRLIEMTWSLKERKVTQNIMIVPAPNLTDLAKIKMQIQGPSPMQQVKAN